MVGMLNDAFAPAHGTHAIVTSMFFVLAGNAVAALCGMAVAGRIGRRLHELRSSATDVSA